MGDRRCLSRPVSCWMLTLSRKPMAMAWWSILARERSARALFVYLLRFKCQYGITQTANNGLSTYADSETKINKTRDRNALGVKGASFRETVSFLLAWLQWILSFGMPSSTTVGLLLNGTNCSKNCAIKTSILLFTTIQVNGVTFMVRFGKISDLLEHKWNILHFWGHGTQSHYCYR